MPRMYPDASLRNFTPSSSALGSATTGVPGVVLGAHSDTVDAVVNDQTLSAASGLPAASFTPAGPPATVAVYAVPVASGAVGTSWIRLSIPPKNTDAGTTWLAADRKSTRLNSSHMSISYAV